MVPPITTSQASTGTSYASPSFHISGLAGTSTRNRLNASLGKQHFVLNPATVAEPGKALFDAVPRNSEFESLRPILARLPLELSSSDDDEEYSSETDNLDYIVKQGVMYTRTPLPYLDTASISLWKALHAFRPLTCEYASGYLSPTPTPPHPISSASQMSSCPLFSSATTQALTQLRTSFNWSTLPTLPLNTSRVWYGVLFLSVRKPGSESTSFYEADRLAHEEATQSGGLIMYWYGSPHPITGVNLATCIWTSRTAAIEASKLPLHKKAAAYAAPSYERYDLVRYKVVKLANEAKVRVEEWLRDDDAVEGL